MERQININTLTSWLKEDVQRENALETARVMFLKECKNALTEDKVDDIYKKNGGWAGYDGISPKEYQQVYRELHKEYWPELDPVKQPYIPAGEDLKRKVAFQADLDARLTKLQVSKGVEASKEQLARTSQLQTDMTDVNKSWTARFWDGLKDSLGDKWEWVKKYAKTAGIAALVLGAVFLVIYGVRQAIEMIRSIRSSKRETRDAKAVTMKLPFKNDAQVQKFCEIVRKKMSRYVEIESIEGTIVEVTCNQEYITGHIGEIQAVIREIKHEERELKMAAESVPVRMTFRRLKKLVAEESPEVVEYRRNGQYKTYPLRGEFDVRDPYGRVIGRAGSEAEAGEIADTWSSMHELDEAAEDNRELTQNEKKQLKRFVYGWMDDHVNANDEDPDELIQSNEEYSCIDSMLGSGWFEDHEINYDELDRDELAKFVHERMKIWTVKNAKRLNK